jgi:hypothetical protein
VLLALGSNQANWGYPDLLVHAGTGWTPGCGIAVVRRDCSVSFCYWERVFSGSSDRPDFRRNTFSPIIGKSP